ncbi:ABC transporter substrate-binding protein [Gordoniibacillus kamchatkensis]|uniref:ABC transporter substrate-binding protein n=1 Tax=Gordoniibacillus kamchatkensis TaxID=1590651 RepID=A0ABR5ALZ6_9BACL|nr:extracellular solute-binding protein [Paenibacillus sp. VKM B-2647]KIL41962.1 ABC transporter substrate-binding protein [Paenibacillus sp. VKM B-2647]
MRSFKKWMLTAIVAALALSTAACTRGESETKQDDAKTGKTSSPTKLVFLTPGDNAAKAITPGDRIVAEINKRLNIDLEVKFVPESGYEKINVAMATGDLPDIVTINYPSPSLSQWISEGLLVPLDDYLPVMPTVKQKIESNLTWTAVNGKYYGYPFIEERANTALAYRADWLETLGMKPPQTLDEFYETLKAIAAKDPGKTGKNDAYGMTGEKGVSQFNFILFAYGLPHGDWVLDNSGKPAPIFEHPAFKQGVQYLRKLWEEKLIDPEFLLNDTQKREQKFYQGKAGFMAAPLFRHVNRIETSLQKVNPNGKLGFMAPPAGPDGKRGMNAAPKGGLFTAITKNAKDKAKAAKFIEFMLSPEGRSLLELGIEGIHYTKQGDKIVYNEAERAKDGFAANGWAHPLAWGNVVWPLTENYLPQTEPQADRAKQSVDIATKNMVPNLLNTTTAEEVELSGVLGELYTQYYLEMITGKRDIDAGIAELSKKWRDQGGNKVLDAVNKAYQAQNKK